MFRQRLEPLIDRLRNELISPARTRIRDNFLAKNGSVVNSRPLDVPTRRISSSAVGRSFTWIARVLAATCLTFPRKIRQHMPRRVHGALKTERTGRRCSAEPVSMLFQFGPVAAELAVLAIREGARAWLEPIVGHVAW